MSTPEQPQDNQNPTTPASEPTPPPPMAEPTFEQHPPVGNYQPTYPPNPPTQSSTDEQTMSYLAVLGMLLLGFIAPLIVFLIAGDDPAKQYSKDQARQALNFSIMQAIAWVVAFVLSFILIGFLLMPLIAIWFIWGVVVGTMSVANRQPAPKYPLTYEFIK